MMPKKKVKADDFKHLKKAARKLGMTSQEFVDVMEKEGSISDKKIISLSPMQVLELVKNTQTVSAAVEVLEKKGLTEFSIGYLLRMMMMANRKMAKIAGVVEKLAGGLSDPEVESINREVAQRGKDTLNYIA